MDTIQEQGQGYSVKTFSHQLIKKKFFAIQCMLRVVVNACRNQFKIIKTLAVIIIKVMKHLFLV